MGFVGRRFAGASLCLCLAAWGGVAGATQSKQPAGATPLGNPGDWVTTSDYPAAALRNSDQGMVVFRLKIDPQGKVAQCVIDQSSGTEELDTATCNLIVARARFSPATDARGRPVEGLYTNRVRWVLPKEVPQPYDFAIEWTYIVEADGSMGKCKFEKGEGLPPETLAKMQSHCNSTNATTTPYVDQSGHPVRKLVRVRNSMQIEAAP